ncbi:glycerol-3-phosphate dehydrogenase [Parvularcula bermudensis HTCC2503]|uniref:Glycerol-3-phosphate dehydrogenase [NAD(P)+] n=1 Tax=Parvularcula bermudensis (strain ATCC BAA-594 / HTCC2503 / KCTC 12087) TaxID=314260 RepID=E0TGW2_PARBH|nr:NAD(P)H-dependent glycerol-3-phosphate dehydrogenase [Parvularcula bermudensis]ADM10721.1 glycerol-3-phosphate dehydrogenase [Parvularcula bermudensis HTCC2503]
MKQQLNVVRTASLGATASAHPQFDTVTVLGAGAWGTALAIAFARAGRTVRLWGRNAEMMGDMARLRRNMAYIPGVLLPDTVIPISDLSAAVDGVDAVFIALPSKGVGAIADKIASDVKPLAPVISCAKGLDPETEELLTDRIQSAIPQARAMFLSGPSFAAEVARGEPTSVVIAGEGELAAEMAASLTSDSFHVEPVEDLIGAQIGGIMKNVIAIACGVADGLGHGSNTRASILARGLEEAASLADALGGSAHTLLGVAGAGDLALACTDPQSRNYSYGRALADPAAPLTATTFEGADSVAKVCAVMTAQGVSAPIACAVDAMLKRDLTPEAMVASLFRSVTAARTPEATQ